MYAEINTDIQYHIKEHMHTDRKGVSLYKHTENRNKNKQTIPTEIHKDMKRNKDITKTRMNERMKK